ncbi:MAG: 3'-5' exonuclease [Candidatus Omnitrophota bacterium]
MKILRPLVILDLETTGTWVEKDRIVEIGLIKLMPGGARTDYIRRVNPGIPIPPNVSRITNITDADVRDKPAFREIAGEALSFLGDSDLAGFNILRFDLPLMEREFYDAGLSFSWRDREIYDAQKIYHIHEKRDLMAAYLLYCGKKLENAHSALNDAEAAMDILDAQIRQYGSEENGLGSLRDIDYERSNDYFDKGRKFCWWNGELYPTFGKYGKKKSLKEIAGSDREYLEWVLTKDFSAEVKAMVKDALGGKFPQVKDGKG